jgi:hypothetical protein
LTNFIAYAMVKTSSYKKQKEQIHLKIYKFDRFWRLDSNSTFAGVAKAPPKGV